MAYEKDENELGSLWQKTSAKGVEYLNGTITGIGAVVCFKAKTTENGPTWRVLKSRPREPTQTHEDAPYEAPRPPARATSRQAPREDDEFERKYEDSDLGF